jgi:lactam utilization protein B
MAERNTCYKDGMLIALLVAASTKIEAGKMVSVGADGYAIEAADTASTICMGIADETADNTTGADGALTVRIRRGKVFKLKNSATNAVVQASVGSNVYVEDDQTVAVAAGPTNDIVAGKCLGVESDGVWVAIG